MATVIDVVQVELEFHGHLRAAVDLRYVLSSACGRVDAEKSREYPTCGFRQAT
jgi:hypothetical protein